MSKKRAENLRKYFDQNVIELNKLLLAVPSAALTFLGAILSQTENVNYIQGYFISWASGCFGAAIIIQLFSYFHATELLDDAILNIKKNNQNISGILNTYNALSLVLVIDGILFLVGWIVNLI